ncbi:hypothetical protein [Paenibacillus sp. DCT19]|uniref:hypothetical protein n=1 Tax=Paenibacillus sp. DCT19 TaxID=2211212 RepID=UPI000FE19799|nr:hypothetical protein [Paenibacillus sp. DCT19]
MIRSPRNSQGVLKYTMDTADTYALGDKVELSDGKELTVVEAVSCLESGLLITSYCMMLEEQIHIPRCELSDLIGLSLYGEVTRVLQDHVQIALTIDEGVIVPSASCPYPVAPTYAAEGHSGLYMMPEKGDTVELYFPGSLESGAYIRHSVPESKRSVEGGTDYKIWGHPNGASMGISPKDVTLQAGSGLEIILNDQGVVLSSPGNLTVQGGSIALEAGQIKGSSPESIWLMGGGSSFILDGQADVRAAQIQQEGTNKAPVHVTDLPLEPEPPLIPIEQYEAAQAAALNTEAEKAVQPSTTNMNEGSLFGAALAISAMIPIMGALGGPAAIVAQGVGSAAAAAGIISSVPKTGSFKPSGLRLLDRLKAGVKQFFQDEEDAKRNLLGKIVTAARELSTATSFPDFIKRLHQQHQEISATVQEIPDPIKKKWVYQQQQQQAEMEPKEKGYRLVYYSPWGIWLPVNEKGVSDQAALQAYEKDTGSLDVAKMRQGPHKYEPAPDIYQLQIQAFKLGIYPYTGEAVSDGYAKMMVATLTLDQVLMGAQTAAFAMYSSKSMSKSPGMSHATSQMIKNIQNAEAAAASKKMSGGNGLAAAKGFFKKKYEESQRVGIVPGSFWSDFNSKKKGTGSAGNAGKTGSETGTNAKPAIPPKTSSESSKPTVKPGSSESNKSTAAKPTPSTPGTKSKGTETPSVKPKEATPKPEVSKSSPVNNKTPNEVNTWKPSSRKDKENAKSKEDTNPSKPKDNKEDAEGTGKPEYIPVN